jgi:hypothetical protein
VVHKFDHGYSDDGKTKPRGFIPDPIPVGAMDDATKAQLEEARSKLHDIYSAPGTTLEATTHQVDIWT